MTILVFPSSLEASVTFAQDKKGHEDVIIGASSLEQDPYKDYYNSWVKLPFIHEENFFSELQRVLADYNISSIFTPHAPTYYHLNKFLPKLTGVNLYGASPYAKQSGRVTNALMKGNEGLALISSFTHNSELIPPNFLASLITQSDSIYGECSHEKIMGLCAAFTDIPKGDVIEIGTFFGKSAYILNRLAAYFHIGATIAIDPWKVECSIQHDSPETIQELSEVWDWEMVFQGFLLTLQACCSQPFNYIRAPSAEAYKLYNTNSISTPEFGDTTISGAIALLHLDGNHDEKAITEDFNLWSQYVAPGGWIVFDDYEWSGGSGPRHLVDHIKLKWQEQIKVFFVAGGAAFIKLK